MPRIAGVLTQLCGAGCVLVGTVAFALLLDQMDGAYLAILLSWVGAGMVALVCGALAGRPSPASLVLAAALDASFCGVLFAVASRLPVWLRILSPEDAASASAAVISIGVASGVAMLACLIATPVALRYWRVSDSDARELGPAGRLAAGSGHMNAMGQAAAMAAGPGALGQGSRELAPDSTAPGFPPPVTGAFRLDPADSGEIVVPAGGAAMRPKAGPPPQQPPRVEKSSLPQQPAPPRPAVAGPQAGQPGFGPHTGQPGFGPHTGQPGFGPHTGQPGQPAFAAAPSPFAPPAGPSPYAPPFSAPVGTPSPYAPAGFAPAAPQSAAAIPMRPESAPAPPAAAAPRPESVHLAARLEPQPPLRQHAGPTPAPPLQQVAEPSFDDRTPPPYLGGYQGQRPPTGQPHAFGHEYTPPPTGFPAQAVAAHPAPPAPPAYPAHAQAPMMSPGQSPYAPPPSPYAPPPSAYAPPSPYAPTPEPAFARGPGFGQPGPMPPFAQGPGFGQPGLAPGMRHDSTPPLVRADAGPAAPAPASRRGLWIAAAGLLVGGIVGLVLLVDSSSGGNGGGSAASAGDGAGSGSAVAKHGDPKALVAPGAGEEPPPGVTPSAGAEPPKTAAPEPRSPDELLNAIHEAARRADGGVLEALVVPSAFGFGVKATSINRTGKEVAAAFAADLGSPPGDGFVVTASNTEIGEEGDHAWIAEELEVGAGGERRRFAITILANRQNEIWRVVAWHWAVRLPDETIETLVEAGDLPIPEGFDDRLEAPTEAVEAFRAAFSSTESYALAVSPRVTAFNFGSAPGERLKGGDAIRRVFRKLRADIRLSEGVMVSAAGSWDPAAAAAPTVAWGAANVEFSTRKSRRILRVLAILVKESDEWRIVQTQWSDGG
jgi:SnoaL-like domain